MKIKLENFDIKQIADSGQCFRMKQIGESTYSNVAYGEYIEITQEKDGISVSCSEEDWENLWADYFHLDYDYGKIIEQINAGDDAFLKKAVDYGSGIRILRQEPFETLITYIISQRKNIPAIKTCVEKLCETLGNKKIASANNREVEYYEFPTIERLASSTKNALDGLGLGYRNEYVLSAAKWVDSGRLNLRRLTETDHQSAVSELKQVYGVGDKVANCTALFGLGHIEAFPIDVWIERVIDEVYGGYFDHSKYKQFAGIVQQYMFYYYRNK